MVSGRQKLGQIGFYIIFAIAITASVQLVGVYLVFANLILPAIASRHSTDNSRLWKAYSVGAIGLTLGLFLSVYMDYATGPAIVCTLFAVTFSIILITQKTGK